MDFLRISMECRSSLILNKESSVNFTENTLELSKSKQLSPWSGKTENRKRRRHSGKGVAGARKIQWVMANLGVALVVEENGRKVNSRGEQDRR
jgi:hypothetical protein